jgi:hypothetical protein
VYYTSFNAGAGTGAVIVAVYMDTSVGGIKATYNSVDYNELSSEVYGYLAGTAGLFTYIGGTAYDCGVEGNTYPLDEYEYTGPGYTPLMTTTNITVTAGEIQTTANDPGVCIMVIPKTTAAPATVDITIVGPCPSSIMYLGVACPIKLPSFQATINVETIVPEVFCLLPYSYTYYVCPVNGDGITLGLYDWVFSDANGAFKLSNGFYRSANIPAPYDTFEVQDGVIIAFHTYCSEYY